MTREEIIKLCEQSGLYVFDHEKEGEWLRFAPKDKRLDVPDMRLIWWLDSSLEDNLARLTTKSFALGKAHQTRRVRETLGL